MIVLGVVGVERAKLTYEREIALRLHLSLWFNEVRPDMVVSGACHLGGVDLIAIEVAREMSINWHEFAATNHQWSGFGGYEARNKMIAQTSTHVRCYTVRDLPPGYTGMRFDRCYHCNTEDHIKSGGCWTVKIAKRMGKRGDVVVLE